MPKLIANLRDSIIKNAKTELLANGFDALAIRGVARACGIAVGTVYNYFPSKDMLVAAVLLEDWERITQRMQAECADAASVVDALNVIYTRLLDYYAVYRPVWDGYTFSESAKNAYAKRHKMLVDQLAGFLRPVLARCNADENMDVFLVENVLICAGGSRMTFDSFVSIVQRVLPD